MKMRLFLMLIVANFFPEPIHYTHYADWERSEFWLDASFRPRVVNARACANLLYYYIVSYHSRDNIILKTKFWKLYLQFLDALGEVYNVPTKRNPRREEPAQTFEKLTFLNLRLTEEQMVEMDNTKATPAQIMTSLAAVIEGGLAFSLNYNQERETANATFMDKREDSPAQNHALSAFGTDIPDALKILLYKHLNVLGGDWAELIGKPQNTNRRG